ncbi:putative quinol monooxygenase [Microbacterium awajiense]|uniref:Quinol monooxygenase n=1 Tax=Microbacterium awajiense TaxID=415214 RepID=A0ABP7AMF3_9MICO
MNPNDEVAVVAVIHPHPDRLDDAKAAVSAALDAVRAEDGCLQYDPHLADDGTIIMVERWASREALAAHSAGAPVTLLLERLEDLVTAPVGVTIAEAF